LIDAGVEIAGGEQLNAAWWWEQGYMALDGNGFVLFPEHIDRSDPHFSYENNPYYWDSQMEDTGEATIRFMLDTDKGLAFRKDAWIRKAGERNEAAQYGEILLPDCTVQMQQLSLTPLSTRIRFQMMPHENTEEAARMLCETYGWMEIWDENARELALADMEYIYGGSGLYQANDGQWVVEWDWTMPGVTAFPKEIHIGMRADMNEDVLPSEEQKIAFEAFAREMVFEQAK